VQKASRWGPFTGDPGRYVKERLCIWASLSIRAPSHPRATWNQEGARIPGTLNDEWRALGTWHLSERTP